MVNVDVVCLFVVLCLFICIYNDQKKRYVFYNCTVTNPFLLLIVDDGPLSPASPQKQKGTLPAYLEPTPQVNQLMSSTFKIRPQLFHLLAPPLVTFPARRATAPTLTHHHSSLYSSLPPRRSHSQSMDPIRSTTIIDNAPPYLSSPSTTTLHQPHHHHHYRSNTNNQSLHHTVKKRKSCHSTPSTNPSAPLYPFQGQDLCTSPTLAAACASAANMHPSTSSASSLGSVSTSASPSSSPSSITTPSDITHQDHPHHIRSKSDEDKKQMDQSMFLTKNAHIKRPRNAWIHVSHFFFSTSIISNSNGSALVVPLSLWPSSENTRSNPPS